MNQPTHPSGDFPIRILVVDDHPTTATTLARALSKLGPGVEVISATSGREALERVEGRAADILITDMIMPEMNGLELVEKLQNHPGGRPAHILLITAYDVPGLKETARRAKVDEVIVKPVRPERICQIVSGFLDEWSRAQPASKEQPASKKFQILIADDRPDNVTLLSRYIQNEGYSYIIAADGVETLERAREYLPDLILLDVNMPKKDGFAVLEEVRADPALQHIPVIILTAARIDPMDVQSGFSLGADDYVLKPFDRRELMARIRTKLRVKETEDAMRRRNRELSLLPEIGKELSARLDVNELADVVLRRTVETLGALMGHIVILHPSTSIQKTHHAASSPSQTKFPNLDGFAAQISESRVSLLIEDVQKEPRWASAPDDPTRSAVIVPMFGRHQLLGLLALAHEQPCYFQMEHVLLLQAIASQAAIAFENARLYADMAQEQKKLAAVLQSAADAILVFDAEGQLVLLNPAARNLFTDYESKLGAELPSGRGYDELITLMEHAQMTQSPLTEDVAWPDGRSFAAQVTPIEAGGHVAVLHDVTRFKSLEQLKNEFIATASHDLKNPITSIAGFSKLMEHAGPLNEQQTEFVERIQSAAQNMNELVSSMLELAQMDLGAELKRENVEFDTLLGEVEAEFQPQAQAKNQKLTYKKSRTHAYVSGDPLKLRQMLANLVGNAIKYTPEGGSISLSMKAEEDMVVTRVQDTGYGIPAADLPFVFDRFYRIRSGKNAEVEGNGLGLAIVKSVVEQHGGNVSVESEVGKGSRFTVSMPRMFIPDVKVTNDLQINQIF
jgi:signal transduction histidine kinase/DNA-binding response OmpR family regulator